MSIEIFMSTIPTIRWKDGDALNKHMHWHRSLIMQTNKLFFKNVQNLFSFLEKMLFCGISLFMQHRVKRRDLKDATKNKTYFDRRSIKMNRL